MATVFPTHEPTTPTREESSLARDSGRALSALTKRDLRVHIPETNEDITLPAPAVRLLVDLLSEMAEGNAVALIPIHAELTTQQAADLLGVSRPFLIKLLEIGRLPFRKVGTHRRILFKDVAAYKRELDRKRQSNFDRLATQARNLTWVTNIRRLRPPR